MINACPAKKQGVSRKNRLTPIFSYTIIMQCDRKAVFFVCKCFNH